MTFRHFSGGPVIKNLPSNAGIGVPSLGGELRSHVLRDNLRAHALETENHNSRKTHMLQGKIACAPSKTRHGQINKEIYIFKDI